ncbi:Glycosyltransferase involved in cell wall bisynthesis [Sphingomonas sp. OV641]|uniref:glycosyltransferase family 4 protein n=1 Tax=Sphingomonas sp. OV641 TaxID=1881068 RepID=UPI0008D0C00A|nr:Glycosyltransferase involved in cell wall bisynthesis [Sphingomonas sp. OV641]
MALKPFRAPAQMLFSKGLPGTGRHSRRARRPIVFDLSRLLSRAYHLTPTGIDRVEYAYAVELLKRVPDRLRFAAVHPAGGYYGRLEIGAVRQFLAFTQARWQTRGEAQAEAVRAQAIRHLFALRPRAVPVPLGQRVYLQASPHHLEDGKLVRSILQTERARFVNLVHDVIPLAYPEFARANGAALHTRRIRTIDRFADGIVANSQATLDELQPHLTPRAGRPTRVAHLGCEWSDPVPMIDGEGSERPYFLCIGTIEPRKNHLLLLNVWRRMAENMGETAPRLILVGRRGWENENVIDLLERSVALRGHVVEQPDVDDRQLTRLLGGARAVLLPSFAEGYGMPVAEALAAGVPVICSDISALREAGGDMPDYLDPLDGIGWLRTILDYASPVSAMRAAQCERMRGWSPMSWARHMDIVLDVVEAVADQRR